MNCPHCQKVIFAEFVNTPTDLSSIFTKEEMIKAKEDACLRVESLSIDDDKKEEVLKWIRDESTIFAPGEVDEIINSLLKSQS